MPRPTDPSDCQERPESLPPGSLVVAGQRYTNSAAKFWAGLLLDALVRDPDCNLIELASWLTRPLTRTYLYPDRLLSKGLDLDEGFSLRKVIADAVAEMDLLGPPASVQIRLLAPGRVILNWEPLPAFVDAELFPFLLVWLLEWGQVPEAVWNSERITGSLSASDRRFRWTYDIAFTLQSRHESEGLHRLTLSLHVGCRGDAP
jgi:hypothetical protein